MNSLVIILHKKDLEYVSYWPIRILFCSCMQSLFCRNLFFLNDFLTSKKIDYFFFKRSKICIIFFWNWSFHDCLPMQCFPFLTATFLSILGKSYSGFNTIRLHQSIQLLYIYRQSMSFLLFQWLWNVTEYHFVKCIVV